MSNRDLIVIGASAGGVSATQVIASGLSADLPAAILIVNHTTPQGSYQLPSILSRVGKLKAVQVTDGDRIEPGVIYVAPPDHHLLVEKSRLRLSRGPKENRTRPAIDPLFRTAAASYGPRVIGVILTGMLNDGTAGLSAVKECGGITVVQDPLDAQQPSMPESALKHVAVDHIAPVSEIAALLERLVRKTTKNLKQKPVPRRIEIESRYARMDTMDAKELDAIGSRAGLSCPDCHGPLWKIKDGTLLRYRCHVGHAYSAEFMAEGQVEAQETYLWQALRLMKERISLLHEMERVARSARRATEVSDHRGAIAVLERNIEMIQKMIRDEQPAGPGTPR